MPQTRAHLDLPGRILALLVILAGVGILLAVFVIAYHMFRSPVPGLGLSATPSTAAPSAAQIGIAMAAFGRQLALLFVMALVGSAVATKGIHLYVGSGHWTTSTHNTRQDDSESAPTLTTSDVPRKQRAG